jgi:hypothetical protein
MAGQFDKYVKILGSGSRPDRFKGAVERDPQTNKVTRVNPDIVAPIEVPEKSATDIGGKNTNITQADVNLARGSRADLAARDMTINRTNYRDRPARKLLAANLKTTTMRLDEKTGEAYDSAEVVPAKANPVSNLLSKGYVKPTGQDPDFKPTAVTDEQVAEVSRPGGALTDQTNAAKSAQESERQDLLSGENAFNTSQAQLDKKMGGNKARRRAGSTLRSLNGVTYDVLDRKAEVMAAKGGAGDFGTYQSDLESAAATNDVIPASTVPAKTSDVEEPKVFTNVKPSGYKPSKSAGDLASEQSDRLLTEGARITTKKQKKEGKNPRGKRLPGGAPKYTGPSQVTGSEAITAPDMDVVDEGMPEPKLGEKGEYTGITTKGSFDPYNEDGTLSSVAQEGILSTTMREVPSSRPDKVLGHVPVRSPRELAGYEKPTVNKAGNVVPPMAIDTFGAQPADRKQAEAENKLLRENRGTPVTTTVFDPNTRSARPTRGQTPEAAAIAAAKREARAGELADQGKEMTTVAPEVMDTAKRLGRTSTYNLDDDYMSSTSFLSHPAVTDATIAHALGVHHTLGTDDDHLAKYLGGRPLEAASRRAAAFKIVDRNLRGNPEKTPGEFALLRGMVHAGSSPQQTLRAVRSGESNDVVVNGQNVTLSPSSSENRQKIASTATNITAQAEAAPKAALGTIAATPTAPLAGSNRVAVRRIGQPPEAAEIREFSPQERVNLETKVPNSDDSKGPRVIDVGLTPGETSPNKILKEEKDS